jgi:hypothetical protein
MGCSEIPPCEALNNRRTVSTFLHNSNTKVASSSTSENCCGFCQTKPPRCSIMILSRGGTAVEISLLPPYRSLSASYTGGQATAGRTMGTQRLHYATRSHALVSSILSNDRVISEGRKLA